MAPQVGIGGLGPAPADAFLSVRDLRVHFPTDDGLVKSVDGLSFDLARGKTIGIVGESGSGKSVTSMAIMGLHKPGTVEMSGSILLDGQELVGALPETVRALRGKRMAMIFQDPLSAMHPFYTVGHQIIEAYQVHNDVSTSVARKHAIDMLDRVGIPQPSSRVDDYPHQFSGGMRQRAMIAMALSCDPDLLIADEPTTALDVTVQAQILELLRDLNQNTGTSIILITHNLGVVAGLCQRVIVMYAGEIVEEGTAEQIFENPQHPYTWSLLRSMPRVDTSRRERLKSIEGLPPDLIAPPPGCKFNPRCPFRIEQCFTDDPSLEAVGDDGRHIAKCWVKMRRAYAEMGAATITDTRPGAASGVRPPKALVETLVDTREIGADPEVVGDLRGS